MTASFAPGDVVAGRYRIEKSIGRGGMGVVFLARHVKMGRLFALKLLNDDALADPTLIARFEREAEALGKLHHPNVVTVIDFGESDGAHYIVMDYASGPTLGALISLRRITGDRAIGIVRQLCDGLHHAHAHGLVHRDFKPDNVIVETDPDGSDRVRIVDFGIAILRDGTPRERLTAADIVLGTPEYMAPEHVTGKTVDHRIDLFALGVICYELFTGAMPFDGDGVEIARANLLSDIPAMAIRAPRVAVDPLLEAFTRRLLEKSPDDRPPSARAARELLDLIAGDREAAAAALGAGGRPPMRTSGLPVPLAVVPRASAPARLGSSPAAVAMMGPAAIRPGSPLAAVAMPGRPGSSPAAVTIPPASPRLGSWPGEPGPVRTLMGVAPLERPPWPVALPPAASPGVAVSAQWQLVHDASAIMRPAGRRGGTTLLLALAAAVLALAAVVALLATRG